MRSHFTSKSRWILGILLMLISAFAIAADGPYKFIKKIPVGGDGGWDYLTMDSAARRLYVSHGSKVDVLDADADKVVGEVSKTPGVHGIAVVPEFNRGFVTCGQTNEVAIFDLKTMAVVSRVPAGKKPDAIIYDAALKRVIVNNNGGDSSTIINAADGKASGTIDLGGAPEFAAADGKGKVFINLEDKSETVKIDPISLKVEARWPLKPCETPSSMAMDTANRRLFIGCRNKLMAVVNADTGKVITTMPIGDHVDATVFEPATGRIFFSNGDGTVDIFHEDSPDRLSVVARLTTEAGAKTMALDPKTHRIFLSTADRDAKTVKPGSFHVLVYGY
ncbi:MAG TPA: YncE family protein [Acidobacteriota bacterium]|nr:YncE family protein [Acidobacteriota bacterium]